MLDRRSVLAAGIGAGVASLIRPSAVLAQQPQSTFDVVKARGTLIAGVRKDLKPAGYINQKEEWVGFDIDMAEYTAKKLGVKLQREVVSSSTRIPMLVNGNVDVVFCTMSPTSERAKVVDFTAPYYLGAQRILVRKDSGIKSHKDLAAPKRTASVQGSNDALVFKAAQPNAEMVYFQEWPQAYLALKQGRVDAVFNDEPVQIEFVKTNPEFAVVGPNIMLVPYAAALRQNDTKWRVALEQVIMDGWKDGSIAKSHELHFGAAPTYNLNVWPEYYTLKE